MRKTLACTPRCAADALLRIVCLCSWQATTGLFLHLLWGGLQALDSSSSAVQLHNVLTTLLLHLARLPEQCVLVCQPVGRAASSDKDLAAMACGCCCCCRPGMTRSTLSPATTTRRAGCPMRPRATWRRSTARSACCTEWSGASRCACIRCGRKAAAASLGSVVACTQHSELKL
jgi:hypothetical protein